MRDVTVRKASKLKSTLLMHRKEKYEVVRSIRRWGPNWMVTTDGGEFVVQDIYLLKKPNASELKELGL